MAIDKTTREAVFLASEGISDSTGEPLDDNWQLDHRIPRAAGGVDDITNLRAVSADDNRSKSCALPPTLRDWQERFLDAWMRHIDSVKNNFLLVALPGAGKTVAAMTVAQRWLDEDPVRRRFIVVVPTEPLRTQWKNESATVFGLQLQTKEFVGFKSGFHGVAVTYSYVSQHAQFLKLLCHKWDVLLICDEIHHAGDENVWGANLKEAFGLAKQRLLMSGTPFRGDKTRIPFVEYDGSGFCVADYQYDYPDAIRDDVIRVVRFESEKGEITRLIDGQEQVDELNSDLSEDEANKLFSSMLQPGNYTAELLRLGHEQLKLVQSSMPNAAGLVLCKDQPHAEQIARQLFSITGYPPDVVVSDDEISNSTVEKFRDSSRQWVVAVRQVSEGVDIKRLMVLVYLTNTRTELFFRQAIGRIVRNLGTEFDSEAYCFIPDHPSLVKHARNITEAQTQAIDEDDDLFDRRIERMLNDASVERAVILGTEHVGSSGAIIEGKFLESEVHKFIKDAARTGRTTEAQAFRLWQYFQSNKTSSPAMSPQEGMRGRVRPLEDQLNALRKAVANAAKRAAIKNKTGDFKGMNTRINDYIGKWDRKQWSLEDCRRALEFARKII